jgi:hypothetical protein
MTASPTAVALALLAVGLSGGCGEAEDESPPVAPGAASMGESYYASHHGLRAEIPPGWHVIDESISNVVYPVQILAAASHPLEVRDRDFVTSACAPAAVGRMPSEGALLQVIEYVPNPRLVEDGPTRPPSLSYDDADFASFECAGPSHRFYFVDQGRPIQAHVWFDSDAVDPTARDLALELLDSIALESAPMCDYSGEPEPRPHFENEVRISGGATCAEAGDLFLHPAPNAESEGGTIDPEPLPRWTCETKSLARYGPVAFDCSKGSERVRYLFH